MEKAGEKSPLKEKYFYYYKSKKSYYCCCCCSCSLCICFFILIILILLHIPLFALWANHRLLMVNYTLGSCEYGSNCVSTCVYDLNKHGDQKMNFKNGLQPSYSWINITGNLTGSKNATEIKVYSHLGRAVLRMSIQIAKSRVVMSHDNDEGPQTAENKWFKVGTPFKLNIMPQRVDPKNSTTIIFKVNCVLPNGTLAKIGQQATRLSTNDSIDSYASMEAIGEIFIASYCYGTCAVLKNSCT